MPRTSSEIVDRFVAAVGHRLELRGFPGAMRHEAVESLVLACAAGFEGYLTLQLRQFAAADAAEADRILTRTPHFVPPLRLPDAAKSLAAIAPRELSELTTTLLEHLYCIVDVTIARAARIPDAAPG